MTKTVSKDRGDRLLRGFEGREGRGEDGVRGMEPDNDYSVDAGDDERVGGKIGLPPKVNGERSEVNDTVG